MSRVRQVTSLASGAPGGAGHRGAWGLRTDGADRPAQSRRAMTTAAGVLVIIAVALSPMSYFRLQGIYLTASDAATMLAFVLLLATGRLPLYFFGAATSYWYFSFLLFCGGLALGSVVNGAPAALASVYLQYFFSLIILPMVIAGRSYPEIVSLIKVLIAALVAVMLFGIYVVHFVDEPSMRLVSGSGRLRSLIERENECAALGAVGMVFVLGLYLLGHLRIIWLVISMPALGYGVLLTGSNSGLIVSVLGTLSIVLLCGSKKHGLITLAILLLCAVIALQFGDAFLPEVFQKRVMNALVTQDVSEAGTFEDRAYLLGEALETARRTLVIGLGADQYREFSAHGAPVHNVYLLILTEGGAVSLFGLIGLQLTGVFVAVQAMRADGSRKVGAVTVTLLLIFALMLNMFPTFYARFWNVPVILAIALSASRLMAPTNTAPRKSRSDPLGDRTIRRLDR